MCLLLFSYKHTPGYRLVLAANRDEFLDRPTAPLGHLDKDRKILAGRDLQGGGTWLGLTCQGKIAAITNYRDPSRQMGSPPSRGNILTGYLQGDQPAHRFLEKFSGTAGVYEGFNLLLGDAKALYHYSNISDITTELSPGLYGLSNHLLDTPWPKVSRGKELLEKELAAGKPVSHDSILKILVDTTQPPDEYLPDTGVGLAWERLLSSMFITSPAYGTRSSAVITIESEGPASFTERSFNHQEGTVSQAGTKSFSFSQAPA